MCTCTGTRTRACPGAHRLSPRDASRASTHLSSQVVARGQVLEAVQAIPVASSSTAGVMVDHLGVRSEAGVRLPRKGVLKGKSMDGQGSGAWGALGRWLLAPSWPLALDELGGGGVTPPVMEEKGGGEKGWVLGTRSRALTSTSQRALELVAEVADWRSVVRRNTCSLPLYSSHVRNFSCSAWNSRTTSPCRQQGGAQEAPGPAWGQCCPPGAGAAGWAPRAPARASRQRTARPLSQAPIHNPTQRADTLSPEPSQQAFKPALAHLPPQAGRREVPLTSQAKIVFPHEGRRGLPSLVASLGPSAQLLPPHAHFLRLPLD